MCLSHPPPTVVQRTNAPRPLTPLISLETSSSHHCQVTVNCPDKAHYTNAKQKSRDRGSDELKTEKVASSKNVSGC